MQESKHSCDRLAICINTQVKKLVMYLINHIFRVDQVLFYIPRKVATSEHLFNFNSWSPEIFNLSNLGVITHPNCFAASPRDFLTCSSTQNMQF